MLCDSVTSSLVGFAVLSRGKAEGHDVDHSPPSNTEVKNEWS